MLVRTITGLFLVAVFVASTWAHDHKVSRGRLVFAYADRPVVGVLDLDSGEVTNRFDVPLPNPRLIASSEGRYVFIVTGDEKGTVRILDTGITFDEHGDHVDIEKGEVRLLDIVIRGVRPSHVVSHSGTAAIFYDGARATAAADAVNAKTVAIDIASLSQSSPKVRTIDALGPQHGLAVALGNGNFAITTSNPAFAAAQAGVSSLPVGIAVRPAIGGRAIAAFDGSAGGNVACPQLHGHAAARRVHVFGCGNFESSQQRSGVMILQQAGRRWKAVMRAYPDDRRVSTLHSLGKSPFAVGSYGTSGAMNALIRVDTRLNAALSPSDVLSIPDAQAVCQFASAGQGSVANLTPDGKLRIYRVLPGWQSIAQFDAVPAFDCSYDARDPKPSLAVQSGRAFVSDPAGRRIREFDLGSMKQGLDMPIDGTPGNLASAG